MRLENTLMFAEPTLLLAPRHTFRKITSGRSARSAWLLVEGPSNSIKEKTSPCSRAEGIHRLLKVSALGWPTGFSQIRSSIRRNWSRILRRAFRLAEMVLRQARWKSVLRDWHNRSEAVSGYFIRLISRISSLALRSRWARQLCRAFPPVLSPFRIELKVPKRAKMALHSSSR